MTDDPALAALTEALASIDDGPYDWGAYETDEFAAAILAHPAMADLARKAAAWDALEWLESLPAPEGFRRWVSVNFDGDARSIGRWEVRTGVTHLREGWPDQKRIGHGATLPDAIAAALAAASPEDER